MATSPDFKTCKVCTREMHEACGAAVAGEFVCAACQINGYARPKKPRAAKKRKAS